MTDTTTTEVLTRPDDRDDWLKLRHRYWNASSAATLLHRHPFQTLHDEIGRKLAGVYSTPENDAMRRGRHLEGAVADWYAETAGLDLYEPDDLYVYDDAIMATLDRRIVGHPAEAVEIKTTAKTVESPDTYWVDQCQAQMLCAGLDRVRLVAMDGTMRLKSWTIERDDTLIAELVDAATPIVAAIRAGIFPDWVTPPPPKKHTDATVELDADAVLLVEDLAALRAEQKRLADDEQRLKRLVGEVLGAAQSGTVNGAPVVQYRSSTRTTIDAARLRAEHPDIAASFSTSKSFRALRIVA